MSLPTEWPYIVKDGNARVPIYKIDRATGYSEFKSFIIPKNLTARVSAGLKHVRNSTMPKKIASDVNAAINKATHTTLILSGDGIARLPRGSERFKRDRHDTHSGRARICGRHQKIEGRAPRRRD